MGGHLPNWFGWLWTLNEYQRGEDVVYMYILLLLSILLLNLYFREIVCVRNLIRGGASYRNREDAKFSSVFMATIFEKCEWLKVREREKTVVDCVSSAIITRYKFKMCKFIYVTPREDNSSLSVSYHGFRNNCCFIIPRNLYIHINILSRALISISPLMRSLGVGWPKIEILEM